MMGRYALFPNMETVMTHNTPDNRSQAEKNADPSNQTDAQKEAARVQKIQDDKDAANRR